MPECPDTGNGTDCFRYLDPRQDPKFQSAVGDLNNPNRRASDIGFFNDFTRDYTQFAAFTSVDFDILENLTLTLGTRYFDIENSMVGANMGSFYCKVYGTGPGGPCTNAFGTNVTEQEDNDNQADGFRSRANLTWRVTEDVLLYTTWSEGYRPGGFNRGSACGVRIRTTPTGAPTSSGASRRRTSRMTSRTMSSAGRRHSGADVHSSTVRSTTSTGKAHRPVCSRRSSASPTCSPS